MGWRHTGSLHCVCVWYTMYASCWGHLLVFLAFFCYVMMGRKIAIFILSQQARWALDNIWRVEDAGLSRNSPNYPGTSRVNDGHKNARTETQVSYRESHEQINQPVQVIVPETERY